MNLGSGLVGSVSVAGLQQVSKHLLKDSPRLDVVGERVIVKTFERMGREPPKQTRLLAWALGNVGADTLLYTAIGFGKPKRAWLRGLLLGGAMGAGALLMPKVAGVTDVDVARTKKTMALTVGIYVLAGLAAGAARMLADRLESGAA